MDAVPEKPEIGQVRNWAQRWLSSSRFESYLEACGNDADAALRLHEWNLRLGQVLMADIAHFELALRNSYDLILRERYSGDRHWLYDEDSPVRRPIMRKSKAKKLRDVNMVNRHAIADAMGRAHDSSDPNQVVSGLMLGFWAHMTDRSRERDLWIPYINAAWPAGTDRAQLNLRIKAINKLRNRVAHNERLFNPGPDGCSPVAVDVDILLLFRALCPEAYEELYGNYNESSVSLFVRESPAPVFVRL